MQLEATYDQGTLKFEETVHFAHNRFKVTVTLPEQEIITPPPQQAPQQTEPKPTTIRPQLNAIIGEEFRQANRGKPSVNVKAYWHQHLEEKHLGN